MTLCKSFLWLLAALLYPSQSLFSEIGYVEPWGKDQELVLKKNPIPAAPPIKNFVGKAIEQVILFHQNVLSPVDGPRSHFRPSSSTYMLFAIKRHGLFKGIVMGCDRLLRENKDPWVYRTKIIDGELYKWDPTYR
ncbi:MAG: membrane protein insertion efficiency factor YidD [Chlamydiota bacterium]